MSDIADLMDVIETFESNGPDVYLVGPVLVAMADGDGGDCILGRIVVENDVWVFATNDDVVPDE